MSSNFRITLKELDGTSRTAEMESSNTIYDVMSKIPDPLGIPADQQRLIFSFLRVKTSKFKSKKSKPRKNNAAGGAAQKKQRLRDAER